MDERTAADMQPNDRNETTHSKSVGLVNLHSSGSIYLTVHEAYHVLFLLSVNVTRPLACCHKELLSLFSALSLCPFFSHLAQPLLYFHQ